jgi:hypothetical protein
VSRNPHDLEGGSKGVRPLLAALTVVLFALAGCSGDAGGNRATPTDDFSDLDVKVTATTGAIVGVVVDEAIRPVADAKVTLQGAAAGDQTKTTDAQGRFAFGNLEPGTYFLKVTSLLHSPAQTSAEAVAGVENPPVVRIQLERLFAQNPYSELLKFDGFLACAYAIGVSSTCVNDYTRIVGERCTSPPAPPACTSQCAGGCLRDYNLSEAGGNIREYVSSVGPGWQSIIFEETWTPTSEAGKNLGFTVSYFGRPNAGHWFGSTNGPNPIRLQLDVGVEHGSASYAGDEPAIIPPEGYDEIFTFFGAGSGSVVINQKFEAFQTSFYYGIPPEGWSFVNGDPMPF